MKMVDYPKPPYNVFGTEEPTFTDSYAKASGQAIYSSDVAIGGMLYAKFLVSPYAHCKIKWMDTSQAEALPGVKAVVRYDDPIIQQVPPFTMAPTGVPSYIILSDEGTWEGDEIGAAVAAVDEETVDKALSLIEVEYEQLPFVLDQEDSLTAPPIFPAFNPNSNHMGASPRTIVTGTKTVEEGMADADIVAEEYAEYPRSTHASPEPRAVVAFWEGDQLNLWIGDEGPGSNEGRVAPVMKALYGTPVSKINIFNVYAGGQYGDFATYRVGVRQYNMAAILSKMTGRPVKLAYDRRVEYESSDLGSKTTMNIGMKNDGTVTAIDERLVWSGGTEGGAAAYWPMVGWGGYWFRNHLDPAKVPISQEQNVMYTNKCPSWWCRDQYTTDGWVFNHLFDRVAWETGVDPTEVALKNSWDHANKKAAGEPSSLEECIKKGKAAIDWDNKWHPPGTKTLPNGKLHGIGFAWGWEWSAGGTGAAGVRVIAQDGSVKLMGHIPNIGLNAHDTYAMVVAETLGVKGTDVFYRTGQEQLLTNQQPGGSVGCGSNTDLYAEAALKAKEVILTKAAAILGVSGPDDLDMKDSVIFEIADETNNCTLMQAMGGMDVQTVVSRRRTPSYGAITPPPNYQTFFCEVEVDPETGDVDVTNFVNVNDVGCAINMPSCHSQQYGGTMFSWGRCFTEDIICDEATGVRLNPNYLEYKISTALECPSYSDWIDNKCIINEVSKPPVNPYGVIGIGEPTAVLATPTFAAAVYNAIGKRIGISPLTPNLILKALGKI